MELARMTSKGQLTVPASIRKKLGIGTGDQLLFYERDGQIVLAPVTPASLADAQAAAARQHIYTLDEIRAIAVPIADRHQFKRLTLFGSYARSEATEKAILISVPMCPRISACSVWVPYKAIWRKPFIKRLT